MTASPSRVLVFGGGDWARETARRLSALEIDVLVVQSDGAPAPAPAPGGAGRIGFVDNSRMIACHGRAGAFQIILDREGTHSTYPAAAIVVAEEGLLSPNFPAYDLQPSGRALALSQAESAADAENFPEWVAAGARIVLLNGGEADSHPVIAARMLRMCLLLQRKGCRTVFLTNNLKVSENGMEACYQAAKAAGALFLKNSGLSAIETMPDGRFQVACPDETTRMHIRLSADAVIVDESISPPPRLAELARILRLDRDSAGWLQSDNVYRLSNFTNRRGIFVAGPSRAVFAESLQRVDAAQAALSVSEFLSGRDEEPRPGVTIDQGRCARCLTCYRLCPHAAVETTPRMIIDSQACQGCGLCAAGCPNKAIEVDDPDLKRALQALLAPPNNARPSPRIGVFCCRRSAVQARETALALGHRLPAGLVMVEGVCGGSFSVNHMLSAFEAGMDGIMVLTCHPGNCRSEDGTHRARQRILQVQNDLALAGVASQRIFYGTLAANMSAEFVRMVDDFSRRVTAVGEASAA